MTKVLVIGLGGVGVMAAYGIQAFHDDVELTAIIRSDYDRVIAEGYSISSIDYGGRRNNDDPNEHLNAIKGFKPHNVVKTLEESKKFGPFDHILVCTKNIPKERNIWDDIKDNSEILKTDDKTNVVLLQNGVDIEKLWAEVPNVNLISGVSYISSVNTKGDIAQYGSDAVLFGLFDPINGDETKLKEFIKVYSNDFNKVKEDKNVRFTRIKKLLYNASYNTFCCLTNADVGLVYDCPDMIEEVFRPLMKEIQLIGNQDLESRNSDELLTDESIEKMIRITDETDSATNYEPSMLVDFRQKREIELEVILGNLIGIYKTNNPGVDLKKTIPYLNFLYYALKMVQYKLQNKLV